jgi:hypothetical protein
MALEQGRRSRADNRVAGRRCLHLSLGRSSTVRPNACGLTQRIRVFICVTAFHSPPLLRPA